MPPDMNSVDIAVRDAIPEDVDALVALSRKTFSDTFAHLYRPDDLNAYLDAAHTPEFYNQAVRDPAFHVRVAETEQGRLGAYMVCSPLDLPVENPQAGALELMRVYVDQPLQGRALGTAFVRECMAWARRRAAPELYLSVFSENEGARRLYERFGFEKVGEFLFPVGEHRDLEFLMRLKLE